MSMRRSSPWVQWARARDARSTLPRPSEYTRRAPRDRARMPAPVKNQFANLRIRSRTIKVRGGDLGADEHESMVVAAWARGTITVLLASSRRLAHTDSSSSTRRVRTRELVRPAARRRSGLGSSKGRQDFRTVETLSREEAYSFPPRKPSRCCGTSQDEGIRRALRRHVSRPAAYFREQTPPRARHLVCDSGNKYSRGLHDMDAGSRLHQARHHGDLCDLIRAAIRALGRPVTRLDRHAATSAEALHGPSGGAQTAKSWHRHREDILLDVTRIPTFRHPCSR